MGYLFDIGSIEYNFDHPRVTYNIENFLQLRYDIVTQAVMDLRYCYKHLLRKDWDYRMNGLYILTYKELIDLRKFFYSSAPLELCGLDGKKIYNTIIEQERELWNKRHQS